MSFAIRTAIAVLAGMGAGVVGYWVTWRFLEPDNLVGFDPWMLVGIFAPGIAVCAAVFWTMSPKSAEAGPASAQ
ncbi:MAG TPA: hypothetical protein VKS79_15515 [Gemmataceae bacterium]|nr:hypothetical protein [Gemmataceae bacterium]